MFTNRVTATHAFNIIYLSGKQAKRSGWTIIDTTNANLSDISNTSNFIINELTEKKVFCYPGCLEEYFFRDDYFNRYFSISNKYIKELDSLISDFKNRIYSGENIEKINTELQSQLLKTNNRYTNKFNITSLKFIAAENSFLDILFKTNLTREYVANIVNKKEYEFYFRALNPELTFYQANKQMVEEHDKIGRVYLENLASGDNSSYSFGIVEKGVSYDITNEGDDIVIRVAGDYKYDDSKAYNVKIPKKIRDLHLPFCVWGGIDCLILQGDEELYFQGLFDSYMKIDTTNSTRYIMEDNGLFYEKRNQTVRKADYCMNLKPIFGKNIK